MFYTNVLTYLVILTTLGLTAKLIQLLVTYRVKHNVHLNFAHIFVEFALIVVGSIFLIEVRAVSKEDNLLTNTCSMYLDEYDTQSFNKVLNM